LFALFLLLDLLLLLFTADILGRLLLLLALRRRLPALLSLATGFLLRLLAGAGLAALLPNLALLFHALLLLAAKALLTLLTAHVDLLEVLRGGDTANRSGAFGMPGYPRAIPRGVELFNGEVFPQGM
jgi:hypothetical protein